MNETWIAGGEHPLRFTPQFLSNHAATACASPSAAASRTGSGSRTSYEEPAAAGRASSLAAGAASRCCRSNCAISAWPWCSAPMSAVLLPLVFIVQTSDESET